LFLSIIVLFFSCKRDDTLSCVKQMIDSRISLNLDQMELVARDKKASNEDSRFIMVCYFDSTECHSCATDKLYLWNDFIEKYGRNHQIDYIFIFYPSKDSYPSLRTFLRSKKEAKNIYIDTLNVFEKANPFVPHASIYHTMLIDKKDNKIKLVGDPRRNQKVEDLFVKIISGRGG